MQLNKKYTHIFFDLDNTLWNFRKNSFFAMQIAFNRFKISAQNVSFDDFFNVYSKHNKLLWAQLRNRQVSKKDLITRRFRYTFDELQIKGIEAGEMNKMYLQEMPKQNKLNAGALEILKYLINKNYNLYIITNGFKEVQFKKMMNSGIDSFFTKVFISEDIKIPKPDPQIFEYAIKSANAKKAKSLMVGDDWEVDVEGALKFGMDAVYFNPNPTDDKQNDVSYKISQRVYFIEQLPHLKAIL